MQKLWQIFDEDSNEILEDCSFHSYTFSSKSRLAEVPLEEGSFAEYNKINSASILSLVLLFSGSDSQSVQLLATLDNQKQSVSKLQIISPEKIFNNFTLQEFSYKKEANSGIMQIELEFVEIKEIALSYTSSSLSIADILNATDVSNLIRGQVQAIAANSTIISKISSYF